MADERVFAFTPTAAVAAGRAHRQFVPCPGCRADASTYLFHRAGVRFVRCASCGIVYANPARERPINNLALDRAALLGDRDRELACHDFAALLEHLADDYLRATGEPLTNTLLIGHWLAAFGDLAIAKRVGLAIAEVDDAAFERLAIASDVSFAKPLLDRKPQLVILHEVLEAGRDLGGIIDALVAALPESTLLAITYTDAESLPGRVMRRYWSRFFDYKSTFLTTANLTAACARSALVLKFHYPLPMTRTVGHLGHRMSIKMPVGLAQVPVPMPIGARVAVFGRATLAAGRPEKLSIVLPVFNEAHYAKAVIDAVLAKPLKIDRELIIVESNSTDGTRDIVGGYDGRPGVTVVYQDRPRGKGHAVRAGLARVSGTIVLIQDADFEYDIDDYDALLEPILQRKATFVLGSRSLGLDDWKVRRYEATPLRHVALNAAQVIFAKTYNALYHQRVTDVNTMFKVFRSDCLDGLDLESNGFDLDIELVCKLARNGHAPMEVPVNYVARGFGDGKKIRFWRDAFPTYAAFFRYRLR